MKFTIKEAVLKCLSEHKASIKVDAELDKGLSNEQIYQVIRDLVDFTGYAPKSSMYAALNKIRKEDNSPIERIEKGFYRIKG